MDVRHKTARKLCTRRGENPGPVEIEITDNLFECHPATRGDGSDDEDYMETLGERKTDDYDQDFAKMTEFFVKSDLENLTKCLTGYTQ
jgi:hypothetical protein